MFGAGTVDIPYQALQSKPDGCGVYDAAADGVAGIALFSLGPYGMH